MNASDIQRFRELCDRQEILDCIHRYCRAVDRADRELLISVYHPDAIDDHGLFVGGREEFADWAIGYHQQYQECTHHIVTNHTCELQGDTAHTETYWLRAPQRQVGDRRARLPHRVARGPGRSADAPRSPGRLRSRRPLDPQPLRHVIPPPTESPKPSGLA